MIRRTFTYRRFQIIAALSVGLFLTVASALSAPLEAQTTGTANLIVRVTGARNAKGKIRVALFRDGKASLMTPRRQFTLRPPTLTRKRQAHS